MEFELGDIVRLTGGESPLRVEQIHDQLVCARYLSDTHQQYEPIVRHLRAFTHHEAFFEEDPEPMNTLYETKDGKFGTELTRNSQGKIVLEMKGSSEVAVYDPADLTEVRPYTVNIHGRHYEVKEGVLQKGDVVLIKGELHVINEIDTKCRKPIGPLPEGTRRVVTEALE